MATTKQTPRRTLAYPQPSAMRPDPLHEPDWSLVTSEEAAEGEASTK